MTMALKLCYCTSVIHTFVSSTYKRKLRNSGAQVSSRRLRESSSPQNKNGLKTARWIPSVKGTQSRFCACARFWFSDRLILVPRAHDPSGLRQESRALGATISGMRHRCRLGDWLFQNGCSQSSRFQTAGQGERGSGNEIAGKG